MPIPEEYSDICDMLLEATKQGRVNWLERGGSFVVRLPQFDFEIWSGTQEDDKRFVAIGLKETTGRNLLDNWFVEEDNPDFVKLDQLSSAARRHAFRVYQKLDEMRGLLKSGQSIGMDEGTSKRKADPAN